MSKKVVVYSSNTCVYCHQAKEYLDSKGVKYTEKNVSKDIAARKELMSKGFMGVPVIMVDDEIVQGFDKGRLDQLLK
jgi:glutaredoxin 3